MTNVAGRRMTAAGPAILVRREKDGRRRQVGMNT